MLTIFMHVPYAVVFVAAMIEGEAMFAIASVLVAAGRLNPAMVVIFGALGAAAGDQFYFYLFRGALRGRFADRAWPALRVSPLWLARIRAAVQRHESGAIVALRFAPGLRIALAATCAWANVSAVRFSLLNLLSAFVWAAALLGLIAWLGPRVVETFGVNARWGAFAVGPSW